jgi:hypothetical protein
MHMLSAAALTGLYGLEVDIEQLTAAKDQHEQQLEREAEALRSLKAQNEQVGWALQRGQGQTHREGWHMQRLVCAVLSGFPNMPLRRIVLTHTVESPFELFLRPLTGVPMLMLSAAGFLVTASRPAGACQAWQHCCVHQPAVWARGADHSSNSQPAGGHQCSAAAGSRQQASRGCNSRSRT